MDDLAGEKKSVEAKGSDSSGSCTARKGNYRATYALKSGTCGEVREEIVNVERLSVSSCEGTTISASACGSFDFDQKCPTATGTILETGRATWSKDGSTGTIEKTVTQYDKFGAATLQTCSGTYVVTYTRL